MERQAADPANRIPNLRRRNSEQSEKVVSKMKIGGGYPARIYQYEKDLSGHF